MNTITLPYLSAAKVCGQDAGSFLQAQLTSDLARLADGEAVFSGYCNRSGNVIAVMRVLRRSEDYVLIAASTLMTALIAELNKYILRARVDLAPLGDAVVGLEGNPLPIYQLAPGFDEGAPGEASVARWRSLEFRSGIVWLGPETSAKFLPQMLGLENLGALSFRKGCYPGQEVIARVRYLGKLKRQPRVAEVEGEMAAVPGSEVHLLDGQEQVGTAEWVDHVVVEGHTTAFLVVRSPADRTVSAIEYGGQRWVLRQAWATM